MFPNLTSDNLGHGNLMQSVWSSNLMLHHDFRGVQFSNVSHIRSGQFRTPHAFTFRMAILLNGVLDVVSACANKYMGRIHTLAIIASVATAHAFWNRAVGKHPCKAMGLFAFFQSNRPKRTIAGFFRVADPQPAGIGLLNFHPEALL